MLAITGTNGKTTTAFLIASILEAAGRAPALAGTIENRLRFADPALTLPQILAAITIIVGAYAVTGPVHGSVMMLVALVLVFGVFNLKPRGARIASAWPARWATTPSTTWPPAPARCTTAPR